MRLCSDIPPGPGLELMRLLEKHRGHDRTPGPASSGRRSPSKEHGPWRLQTGSQGRRGVRTLGTCGLRPPQQAVWGPQRAESLSPPSPVAQVTRRPRRTCGSGLCTQPLPYSLERCFILSDLVSMVFGIAVVLFIKKKTRRFMSRGGKDVAGIGEQERLRAGDQTMHLPS